MEKYYNFLLAILYWTVDSGQWTAGHWTVDSGTLDSGTLDSGRDRVDRSTVPTLEY